MKQKIIFGLALAAFSLMGCKKDEAKTETKANAEAASAPATQNVGESPVTQNADTLKIEDQKVGTGDTAVPGKTVVVHYTGWLTNGTKFDSSVDRNEAFEFPLGQGRVIQGWDQGVANMKVGGKRKLTIPPALGYGARDLGVIPPNSTLVFEVELLKVK